MTYKQKHVTRVLIETCLWWLDTLHLAQRKVERQNTKVKKIYNIQAANINTVCTAKTRSDTVKTKRTVEVSEIKVPKKYAGRPCEIAKEIGIYQKMQQNGHHWKLNT